MATERAILERHPDDQGDQVERHRQRSRRRSAPTPGPSSGGTTRSYRLSLPPRHHRPPPPRPRTPRSRPILAQRTRGDTTWTDLDPDQAKAVEHRNSGDPTAAVRRQHGGSPPARFLPGDSSLSVADSPPPKQRPRHRAGSRFALPARVYPADASTAINTIPLPFAPSLRGSLGTPPLLGIEHPCRPIKIS